VNITNGLDNKNISKYLTDLLIEGNIAEAKIKSDIIKAYAF
jgi:hypothetical protein